jgi:hypothetical protein
MFHSDEGAGVYTTAMARHHRRRRRLLVGVVALAVVLGGSAYAVTAALTGTDQIAPDTGALAPIAPEPSEPPSVAPSRTATKSVVKPTRTVSLTPSVEHTTRPRPHVTSATARAGTQARPPAPRGNVEAIPAEDITVTNTGSLRRPEGTMRLVTARGDMAGQRELAWVADDGEKYGDVRCSQTFNFSQDTAPTAKPTMLICWRTSAEKSVYTVAVQLTGPDPARSVALITKEWARLG